MIFKVFAWYFKEQKDPFIEIVWNIQATGPNDESGYLYSCEAIVVELSGYYGHSMCYYDESYDSEIFKDAYELKGLFVDLDAAMAYSRDILKIIEGERKDAIRSF